jgi:hypothetical protein
LRCLEEKLRLTGAELFSQEHAEQQKELFRCLSLLNSVANVNRKGREDLGPEVFEAATAAKRRGEAAPGSPNSVIINEVAESFEAMRRYLRQVEPFLDQVAPRLSENTGLAARLAQLEEGWELGQTYLLNEQMRDAMASLVRELRAIQNLDPKFKSLSESCDVEWLLVLPKLVWLCFLENPARFVELMRSLLPHRFPEESVDAALKDLSDRYRRVISTVMRMRCQLTLNKGWSAWEILVQWASFGVEGFGLQPSDIEAGGVLYDVLEFVKELESWSMELQRHCPQDWNQCSSLLVRCLAGCQARQPEEDFII